MALTLDPATKILTVLQSDLTLVSGTLYSMDTNSFKNQVRGLLADEAYIWLPPAIKHNTEVTVAGTTYARTIEIIDGYSVEFSPNTQWTVRLEGSNNNIFDVQSGILVQNQVQVIPTNAAGLITVVSGSGFTSGDALKLLEVWQDRGLDVNNPKTINLTTETSGLISKIRARVGDLLTITRQ